MKDSLVPLLEVSLEQARAKKMNNVAEFKPSNSLALQEAELVNVLASSLYPGAALDSIKMVLGYCRAAGLDPMQKPVHIVPMWDGKAQRMRDVIMPGVNLYRIQASRSGQFAGISEPEFGPEVTQTLSNQEITFPEWCRVTVKRQLASGHVAEFTAREFWIENYAVKGGKEKSLAPNSMWTKRPKGQIAKCAAAQALRSAFPEIAAQYTVEEMEGKDILAHEDEDPIEVDQHYGLTGPRAKMLRAAVAAAIAKFDVGDEWGAWEEIQPFQATNEELQAVWHVLRNHSTLKASIKKSATEQRRRDDEIANMTKPASDEPTEDGPL